MSWPSDNSAIATIATAKHATNTPEKRPDPPAAYRGRFAPSPSGPLHVGSVVSALASYLDARANNGAWLLRIEDIDPPREPTGAKADILRALEFLGFEWDEKPLCQSTRLEIYQDAIDKLLESGNAYYCQCSRRDIRAKCRRGPLGEYVYDGHCANRQLETGAVRVRVDSKCRVVHDAIQPTQQQNLAADLGDFIIRRRDGLVSYQIAVVVDDAFQQISHVVRGIDLWDNAPRQQFLQDLLELRYTRYVHVPVVVNTVGDKLSKQTGAAGLVLDNASKLLHNSLTLLQHWPPIELLGTHKAELLRWAVAHWDPAKLEGLASVDEGSVAPQQNPLL